MPEISSVKHALQTVVKKDRFLNAVFVGSKSFVVAIARTAYAFWLQATGLVFLLLAMTGGSSLVRQYHKDQFADRKRFWVELIFTLVCSFFTVHSFVKASRTVKRK